MTTGRGGTTADVERLRHMRHHDNATGAHPGASVPAVSRATDPTSALAVAPADLLDRVLGGGVVVSSEVTVAAGGVDLVRVRVADVLRAVSLAERWGVE